MREVWTTVRFSNPPQFAQRLKMNPQIMKAVVTTLAALGKHPESFTKATDI